MVAKPRRRISYFDFLTNCLQAWCQYLITSPKQSRTDRRARRDTSFSYQNLQGDLGIIPSSQKYLSAVANVELVSRMQHISWMINNSQATGTYLRPELDVVRSDHPVLQFHPESTGGRKVSQNVREKLPFSLTICTLVNSSLE